MRILESSEVVRIHILRQNTRAMICFKSLIVLLGWLVLAREGREINQVFESSSSVVQHPRHTRQHLRSQFAKLQANLPTQQVGGVLASEDACRVDKLVFPIRSVIINSDPKYKMVLHGPGSDTFISDSLYSGRGNTYFEKDIQSAMERLIPKDVSPENIVILDIGANIGLHALYFASKGYEVHAFEPFATNYYLLQCSKVANNFKNLYVNNFGLSNRTQTACMGVSPTNQGHAFVKPQNECNQDDSIELRTLDEYMDLYLGDKEIFLAKIDVEGYEITAWLGGLRLLRQRPPKYVFSEVSTEPVHKLGQTAQLYFELMEQYGYSANHMKKFYEIKSNNFPPELEVPNHLYDVKFTHQSAQKI